MALSGTNTSVIGGNMSLRVAWTATQNIANNTSTVTSNLYIDFTNSALSVGLRSDAYMTIDGVNIGFTAPAVSKSGFTGSVLLGTVSKVVNHNSDGTKSLTVTGVYPIRATISGTYIASVTVTTTGTLDTIPRASTPTLSPSSQTMGSSMTITTNRASTAFTHTLKYTFGSLTGTIATGVGASYAWTVPLTLANAIPNATSGAGTITTETYNGTSLIGTSSVSFTATVPTSVVPVINSVTIAEAVSGLATKFLAYVQNKSKLTVTTSSAGAYSSTISEVKVTTQSKSYVGTPITTDFITSSGTVAVVVLVTDSRGRTATTTTNITVQAYTNPTITSYSAYRVNGSGVASDSGTSISAPINFTISSVNSRNDKTWALTYRVAGTSTWASLTSGSVYTYNQTYSNLTGLFNANNSYEIRLTITDYFTSAEKIVSIGTAFTLLNFNATGKGLAIGKVSEADNFEVAIPSSFTDTVTANNVTATNVTVESIRKGTSRVVDMYLGTFSTTTGTANQKMDILIPNTGMQGVFEVKVTGNWSSGNAYGVLIKRYSLVVQSGGTISIQQTEYTDATGFMATKFAIGDLEWDATNSRWRIQLAQLVSNVTSTYVISALYHGSNSNSSFGTSVSLSSLYTTDTTVLPTPVIQRKHPVAFASGSASGPSITSDGDTNTGIYYPAADTIGFTTNGVNRATIDADGLTVKGISRSSFITQAQKTSGTTMAIDYANGDYQSIDISGASTVTITISNFPLDRPAQMTIIGTNSSATVGSALTFAITGITSTNVKHGTSLASTSLTMSTNSVNSFVITSYKQNSAINTIFASVKMS